MIDFALKYNNIGWIPIPMIPQTASFKEKKPHIKWKKYQTEKPTEKDVQSWFAKWPLAGIGTVTGKISNLLVVDFDGEDAIRRFEAEVGERPNTIRQVSRCGHEQDLYKYPGSIKNITGLFKGVDVRGEGGLIVLPPTKHWSGSSYQWDNINPAEMGLEDLLDVSAELLDLMKKNQRANKNHSEPPSPSVWKGSGKGNMPNTTGIPDWFNALMKGVDEGGGRNVSCARLAGWYLRKYPGDKDYVLFKLKDWNQKNRPPLDEAEIRKVMDSIASRQGIDEFGGAFGFKIDHIIFYKSPEGNGYYEFYIDGNPAILRAEDLNSCLKFRTRITAIMPKVLKPMSNAKFSILIEAALADAEVIPIAEELTDKEKIKTLLQTVIKEPSLQKTDINSSIVVSKDRWGDRQIYLKLARVNSLLKNQNEEIPGNRILQALKSLGFKHKSIADEEARRHKVWHLPLLIIDPKLDKEMEKK